MLCGKTTATESVEGTIIYGATTGGITSSITSTSHNTYHVYRSGATGGGYKFYVNAGGAINSTQGSINVISDVRLKENIEDLDDGLAKVMELKPRKFDWKEGKGPDLKNVRGFIAQEFEDVFPDLIGGWLEEAPEGEEPYKSINVDLLPTLVKAIQEQQALIEALQTKVAALEGE